MKTSLLIMVGLLTLLSASSSYARLGEDEIQCEERYGFARKELVTNDTTFPLITGNDATTRSYFYQGWRVRVGFLEGVAVREEYWKITGPGRTATIADYEAAAILDAEKSTGKWLTKGMTLTVNYPKALQEYFASMLAQGAWVRSDGAATATLDMLKMRLRFESVAAVQHDEAMKQAHEQKQHASVPQF